jgi:PAS domain S-box-containing protein
MSLPGEREYAERRIASLHRCLRTISDINQLIGRENDRNRLLEETCRIIVERGGFRLAWVGEVDFQTRAVIPAAQYGFEEGYLEAADIRLDDSPRGSGPVGRALRTAQLAVCHDTETDACFIPWREAARNQGYRAMAAFPLKIQNRVSASINIYAGDPGLFGEEMIDLLQELAADLSFAIEALDEKKARQKAEEALKESEARYRDLYDNAPDMYLSVSAETGEVMECNQTLCDLTGFPREEVVGRQVRDLYHPDCRERVRRNFRQFSETGRVRDEELTIRTKDGRAIRVSLNATAVKDDRGRILHSRAIWRDVTRQKEAEKTLRGRDAKIQSIFRAAPVGIGLVSYPDRLLLEVNDLLCRMVDYAPEELIGQSARMIYPSDEDFHRVKKDKYAQIETRGTGTVETRWRRKDGTVIDVLLSSTPLNPEDYSAGVTFTALDITARKRGEEAQQNLAQKWRITFDAINDSISLLDDQSRVVQCNRAMTELLQRPAGEIIGRPCYELMDGAEGQIENCPSVRALQTRKRETRSWQIGGRWFDVVADPILDPQGRVTGAVHILSDITETKKADQALKEREAHLSTLIDSSMDAILTLDTRRVITEVNQAFVNQFGYSREEARGLSMAAFHPDDRSFNEFGQKVYPRIRAEGHWQGEWRYRRRDGTLVPMDTVVSALYQADGSVSGYVSVMRDITERLKAEEQKRALERQLRQAQKLEAIGTLAGGIAHDFNNILGAVIGFTELARMELPEGSPARNDLDQVLKAGLRAKDLVRQILTFSRKGTETLAPIDVVPIVKEALKMLRASLPTTVEIKKRLVLAKGAVKSEPTQIHQILMNLCTNAAQAMGEQGGVLEITLAETVLNPEDLPPHELPASGPFLELAVRDSGPGIAKEVLEHIFEPYFTTKEKGLGSGLGLSVVHGIVQRHGGWIRVESEPGAGSCFRVFLPLLNGVPVTPPPEDWTLPRGREHILAVDDEKPLREILMKALDHLGYRVTATGDPREALTRFAEAPDSFDLVITDMTMPKLTGDRLIEEILSIRPGLPVIICTGYSDQLSETRVREIGARALLMKPFEIGALAQKVREVLDKG